MAATITGLQRKAAENFVVAVAESCTGRSEKLMGLLKATLVKVKVRIQVKLQVKIKVNVQVKVKVDVIR